MTKVSILLDEDKKLAVLEQLKLIVESEFFRGSQRCRQFLEYSVNYVLENRPLSELKERVIGIEVFRKAGNYDTAQDNIVRVTANEVRKRLAQYYGESDHKAFPLFQLPSGSYAVSFRWASDEVAAAPAPSKEEELTVTEPAPPNAAPLLRKTQHWKYASFGLAVFVVIAVLLYAGLGMLRRNSDLVHRVWSPFLDNPKALVICMGEPVAYRPASNHDQPLGPDDKMVPLSGQFIGTGDAYALADIARYISHTRTDWTLLTGSSTSSETLFNSPSILVGAYSNPWTLTLTNHLRFYFGANNTIYDRSKPEVQWKVPMSSDWKTGHDYAVVSRFISPSTGQPIMIVAGVYSYGTRVAAGFVLDRELLADALRDAPKDWEGKNFQFVLHTKIIGNTPARPQVVATHYW